MTVTKQTQAKIIQQAVSVLRADGVIAYPTEYCFGLGCDPRSERAVQRLLEIKRRDKSQGVILIAANSTQVQHYADLDSLASKEQVLASWPGPNTWLLPAKASVSQWVRGDHSTIAMRVPDHALCLALCEEFDHPIVSTSANRHAQPAHLNAKDISVDMGGEVDMIIDASLGGASSASTIRHAISGEILR